MLSINSCLENSTSTIKQCYQICHRKYGPDGEEPNYYRHRKCHEQCSNDVYVNVVTCVNNVSDDVDYDVSIPKNELDTCISTYGCGSFPLYDKSCLNNNKDDILNCCQLSCISCNVDCQKDFNNIIVNGNGSILEIMKKYDLKKSDFEDKTRNNWFYIAIATIVAIAAIILTVVLVKRK